MSTLFPAHAFSARYDLPIPLLLFVVAGVAVVVVSILLVRPRAVPADDANAEVPDRVPDAALNAPTTVVSLAILSLLGLGGLLGSNAVASEYPWRVAMVAYTAFSLLLIAQPLAREGNAGQSAALAPQSQVTQQSATAGFGPTRGGP